MKYVKKVLGISFFSLLPLSAEAESYCNPPWVNNTLPNASVDVSFDGNTSRTFLLNLQAGGLSTITKRVAESMGTSVTLDGTYRYWAQYPEAWQTTPDGLKHRITSELEASGTQTASVKIVVTSVGYHTRESTYGCRDAGGIYDFEVASVSGVNIEIDRGTARPGTYSIQLPVKIAYEENKGDYDGKSDGGWQGPLVSMKSLPPVDSKGVSMTMSSKYNAGEQSLSVNMDDNITLNEAKSDAERKASFPLTCNIPAKVSLSLRGADIVDGVNNRAKRGSGSCSLSFDNDSSSKILEVNQGTYQVPIIVCFQNANPVAGGLDGSTVLSVNILQYTLMQSC